MPEEIKKPAPHYFPKRILDPEGLATRCEEILIPAVRRERKIREIKTAGIDLPHDGVARQILSGTI